MEKKLVTCNCGYKFLESTDPKERIPCPNCGQLNRALNILCKEKININERIGLKSRRQFEKKPCVEVIKGKEINKSTGDMVEKDRLIDRDKKIYKEKIVDKDGKILRNVVESLYNHQGHGSAKKKKK